MSGPGVTLLDGGMGRQLARMGAPFRQPEWSALALIEAPETVQAAHEAFIAAGAEVITTNSYALVPFHIGEERFAARGLELADLSGRLARQAAESAVAPVRVAGSLPPLFGSYRPDLFEPERAPEIAKILVDGLAPHVDLWLAETQSSIREVAAAAAAVAGHGKPLWISYTIEDERPEPGMPRLRSGEPVDGSGARGARPRRRGRAVQLQPARGDGRRRRRRGAGDRRGAGPDRRLCQRLSAAAGGRRRQ